MYGRTHSTWLAQYRRLRIRYERREDINIVLMAFIRIHIFQKRLKATFHQMLQGVIDW